MKIIVLSAFVICYVFSGSSASADGLPSNPWKKNSASASSETFSQTTENLDSYLDSQQNYSQIQNYSPEISDAIIRQATVRANQIQKNNEIYLEAERKKLEQEVRRQKEAAEAAEKDTDNDSLLGKISDFFSAGTSASQQQEQKQEQSSFDDWGKEYDKLVKKLTAA